MVLKMCVVAESLVKVLIGEPLHKSATRVIFE